MIDPKNLINPQFSLLETSKYAQSIRNLPIDWEVINDEKFVFALGHLFLVKFYDFCNIFGEHKEGCLIASGFIKSQYDISLHLFLKKDWISKHRVPYPRARQKLYKPKAEVFSHLFRLIERCLSYRKNVYLPSYQLTVTDTPTWFSLIIIDWIKRDITASVVNLDNSEPSPAPKSYRGRKKQSRFSKDRAFITKLEQLDDSFLSLTEYRFFEATTELYRTAIDMSNRFDQFRKQFWKRYIKALRDELKSQSSSEWTIGHVEFDKFKGQFGRGRGEVVLTRSKLQKSKLNFTTLT